MTNTNRPVTEFSHKTSTELPQERSQGLNVDPTDVNARPDLDTNRVPDMNEAGDHPVGTSVGVLGGGGNRCCRRCCSWTSRCRSGWYCRWCGRWIGR